MVRTMSATGLSTIEDDRDQNRNRDHNPQIELFIRQKEKQIDSALRMTTETQEDMNQNEEHEYESNLKHNDPSVFEDVTTKSSSILRPSKYHVTDLRPKSASTDTNDIGNDDLFQSDLSDDDINDNTISTDSIPTDIAEIQFPEIHHVEAPDTDTIYPIPDDSAISSNTTTTSGCQRVTLRRSSSTAFDNFMRFGT